MVVVEPLATVVPPTYVLVSVSEDDDEARLSNSRLPLDTREEELLTAPLDLPSLANLEGDDNLLLVGFELTSAELGAVDDVYLLTAPVVAKQGFAKQLLLELGVIS